MIPGPARGFPTPENLHCASNRHPPSRGDQPGFGPVGGRSRTDATAPSAMGPEQSLYSYVNNPWTINSNDILFLIL